MRDQRASNHRGVALGCTHHPRALVVRWQTRRGIYSKELLIFGLEIIAISVAVVEGIKKPMTCDEFVDSLQAFRDDELTLPERIRAQEHLVGCEKCSVYLRRYEQTIKLAKSSASDDAEAAPLPESLVRRIMAARRRS
jgi:Putative zinc-finger